MGVFLTPFLWGVIAISVGGLLVDLDSFLGYALGLPVLAFGFLSLKHLAQRLIFFSSFKIFPSAIIAMFFSILLADQMPNAFLAGVIIATGLACFIVASIHAYYRNMFNE